MSRRDAKPKFDIIKAIELYQSNKAKEKALNTTNADLNTKIKSYMQENNCNEVEAETCTAKLSVTQKTTLNDELAIEIIKSKLGGAMLNTVIKTKEYIDEDALEKLVYNGDFEISALEPAKIVTPVTTLRISKRK